MTADPPTSPEQPPSRPRESPAESLAAFVEINILRIPVPVWARTQEHVDELLRECTLMAAQRRDRPEEARSVPVRLTELVEKLTRDYAGINATQASRLAAASAAGVAEIDLVYRLPPQTAEAARRLQQMLDEVDAYCRAGEHLLTLATPPELARFRRWMLEEVINQIDGAPPVPYPDYRG